MVGYNKAMKNRPQKAVGWTRYARLLLRRYAWYLKKRFVGFRFVVIVFLVCAAPAVV